MRLFLRLVVIKNPVQFGYIHSWVLPYLQKEEWELGWPKH